MTIAIKWFPPSWTQIKVNHKIIYIDPAYLRTYYTKYPKKIEFSKWPDPIDGLPEKLPKADIILITHDHADHCKKITVDRLKKKNTLVIGPKLSKNAELTDGRENMKMNWTIFYYRYNTYGSS